MGPENVFRPEYRELTVEEGHYIQTVKDKAYELYCLVHNKQETTNGREMGLAKTKLEEAVMWAVKGLTK